MTTDLAQKDLTGELLAGRYRFERLLGSGGMGRVYLAEDEVLHRRVAVKLLQPQHAADPRFVDRFRREARAAAGLAHPHIVAVHDLGEADDIPYIVMGYVCGQTLKDVVCREGRLQEAEARRICLEVLQAAAHAHGRGVIHRDLTSRNILLDNERRVHVVDFGIARLSAAPFTTGGMMVGTAHYAAPEQIRGEPADARTDVYTVGVVLYEMLTGVLPFEGSDAMAVAVKHLNEPPPRPSGLEPTLSPVLEGIVLKAMAKEPGDRFQTSEEFAAALNAAAFREAELQEPSGERGAESRREKPSAAVLGVSPSADGGEPRGAAAVPPTRIETGVAERTQTLAEGQTAVIYASARQNAAMDAPGRRHRRLMATAAALILVATVAAGAWWFFGRLASVPNAVGKSVKTATTALAGAGFEVDRGTTYSERFAEGVVARQSPQPGERLKSGGDVRIWVSLGPLFIQTPEVVGLSEEGAQRTLREKRLVGSALKGRSDEVAAGQVYRQLPPAGVRIKRGQAVSYWVSVGPTGISVPDVTGRFFRDAEDTLRASGFTVDRRTVAGWGTTPLTVVEQNPTAGQRAPKGSTVVIWISIF